MSMLRVACPHQNFRMGDLQGEEFFLNQWFLVFNFFPLGQELLVKRFRVILDLGS